MKKKPLIVPLIVAFVFSLMACNSSSDKSADETKKQEEKEEEKAIFKRLPTTKTGIKFINSLKETPELNIINYHYFYNGGGVAAGDLNNDGLIDLYFTSNQQEDKLYLNKGNFQFEDITDKLPKKEVGIWSTGVLIADLNSDGLLDIYLSQSGRLTEDKRRNRLLINQGDLSFKEEAKKYGLDDAAYSTQAAVLDFDQDGDLDLFLLNHEIEDIFNFNKEDRETGYNKNVGDKLYRNDGDKFNDISEQAGIKQNPYGFGLGVAVSDLNNDSWPDIYVSNDFSENDYMYINQKNGTFKETIKISTKHNANYGMGVDASDINNDGLSDIIVVDMVAKDNYRQKTNMSGMNPEQFWKTIAFGFHYQYMYNTLNLNQGGEKFSDVAKLIGVSSTDWSWSPLIVDFDLDGNKDIFISNGLRKDVRNNDFVKKHILYAEQKPENKGLSSTELIKKQLKKMPSTRIPNYIFKNNGDLNFEEQTQNWGLKDVAFSTGAIYADLDNDGDQDLIINNVDDTSFVYENIAEDKKYVSIQLKGTEKNRFAIGAKLILQSNQDQQMLELNPTRGFQSSILGPLNFAVNEKDENVELEIIWPDGSHSQQKIKDFNTLITIKQEEDNKKEWSTAKVEPVIKNISEEHGIDYNHFENYYDDFKDQVLLPHQLSNLGPGLAVGDVNGDGLEDFFVGSAVGYYPALYLQDENGKFKQKFDQPFEQENHKEEMQAQLFDFDGDNDLDLYIGYGSYEFAYNSPLLQDAIYLNDGKGKFKKADLLPPMLTSTSVVIPFDFDNDNDLDLFIGSRMQQKRYPLPPNSYLLENRDGKYVDVTSEKAPDLKGIGMITAAVSTDHNQDGNMDLIISGEWMKLSILENNSKKFSLIDHSEIGLDKSGGWWYALALDDIDKDGDQDLITGNLGKNYKYQASEEQPFKVFSNDFDNNQKVDIILSYSQKGTYYPLRGRQCSAEQLPELEAKFPDYNEFAQASVYDVIGHDEAENSYERNAHTFANGVYLNKDGKYQSIPFGNMNQISSINSILVYDLNQDGYNDLIMAGNLYSSEVETPRNDASYGHILINQKDGSYKTLTAEQAAFFGEGEVKALKAIEVKGVGDAFLVARNNGLLQLFTFSK